MKRIIIVPFLILFSFCTLSFALARKEDAQQDKKNKEPEFVGEFFGIQVPAGNYYFIKGALTVFGNKWGPQPQTPEERENYIWDQLLLSYEAFRRNIAPAQEEVDKEISKILESEKVKFDWKKDQAAYAKWMKEKTNEPTALFENQIRYLLQIEKLRQQVMESFKPQVSDEEAQQKFLNQHNSLSIELVQFDQQKEAEEFYKKAKANKRFWEEEKKKRPNDFKRPGFVALEFLMDIWKIPKDALYQMMKMKTGTVHPPAPIYKGYGVFLVLEQRPADDSQYAKLRDNYIEQIKQGKRYAYLSEWFKDLKQQANIKIYKKGGGG